MSKPKHPLKRRKQDASRMRKSGRKRKKKTDKGERKSEEKRIKRGKMTAQEEARPTDLLAMREAGIIESQVEKVDALENANAHQREKETKK